MDSEAKIFPDNELGKNTHNRLDARAKFGIDIFYPRLNNESVYEDYDTSTPLLRTTNISESGICFVSRIPAKPGDFMSFMLKVEDSPSFWCLCEVRWVEENHGNYMIGCRFFLLSELYLKIIREYVKKNI